jgi:hypothetical protein
VQQYQQPQPPQPIVIHTGAPRNVPRRRPNPRYVPPIQNNFGGNSCWNCGDSSHFSRECPLRGEIGYGCQQPGYFGSNCPNRNNFQRRTGPRPLLGNQGN